MRCARHCEERSDEVIQEFNDFDILGLLHFARNGGILHIYSMFLLNETALFIPSGDIVSTHEILAHIAKTEAQRFFHGRVMKTEHNIHEIIAPFPKFHIDEADGMWCAAFVYYCCIKAGFNIPIKPSECSCNLAGCRAWEELAIADARIVYATASDSSFIPSPGDIVLFDNVFIDQAHDHIGIVVENRDASIVVAEGNINNVSGVVERKRDSHIRAYIRLPDSYNYIAKSIKKGWR